MDVPGEALEMLRNARFPVYVVPPSKWYGDVMLRGAWGSRNHPLSITISYDDDLDLAERRPVRRVDLTSTGSEGMGHRSPADHFLLWDHGYHANIVNFVNNVTTERLPERPIPGSERYNREPDGTPHTVHLPSAGPRRLIDAQPFRDGSQIERVAFDEYPHLRMSRVQMPEIEILMLAWAWDDDFLVKFMQSARSIRDDDALFSEVERAEHAAWQKIRERKRREGGHS